MLVNRHGVLSQVARSTVKTLTSTSALASTNAAHNIAAVATASSTSSITSIQRDHSLAQSTTFSRAASTSVSASGLPARSVIVKLLQNIGSKKEVEQYLKYYGSLDATRFAVIKVGGGLILDDLDTLAASLSFLADVGLYPVVIHGAGPQLNAELEKQGIVSDYIGGMRITTPEILATARMVFQRENLKLVEALEERGTRCRPITSGVFQAEFLDQSKFGLVGQITSVDCSQVRRALEKGFLPILTCMGESTTGQILNVNADVAAQELAKALRPVKIVYLSANGGLRDEKDQLMPVIDTDTDYENLMVQPWFKHGNRLKLKEIKTLLDALPPSSSVAITSAANLPKELFTQKGSGTLIRRSERINSFKDLNGLDQERLKECLESSFNGKLNSQFLQELAPKLHALYITENYRATSILTLDPPEAGTNGVPYLDKFAVSKLSQSEGTGQTMWQILKKNHPQLYWRSRSDNPINAWYLDKAQGSWTEGQWTVFWYGISDFQTAQACIKEGLRKPASIERNLPSNNPLPFDLNTMAQSETRKYSTSTGARRSGVSFSFNNNGLITTFTRNGQKLKQTFSRSMSTSTKEAKVGIIGARGHTGGELMKLLAAHPQLSLSVASSRALKGKPVNSLMSDLPASCKWGNLPFVDLQPAELPKQDVDLWILALPNDLAKPYVEALDADTKNKSKVVDLSADYRFHPKWQYGLPERRGFRQKIAAASRVANPGCYATGMQVALLPISTLLNPTVAPVIAGISGYSGAGTNPSRKNDPNELRDNLMPYTLQNHMHEREVSFQLADTYPLGIRFMPHVAPWFRGITLTVAVQLKDTCDVTVDQIYQMYHEYFKGEAMVKITKDIPEVRSIQGTHFARVGGLSYDPKTKRLVICSVLDNLLKGAASQCMQNINLMLGLPEYTTLKSE